jgi:hypothetical protein
MKPRFRSYDPFASLNSMATPARHQEPGPRAPVARDPNQSILERRYPAMARTVSMLWGFPELNDYFDRLWLSDGHSEPIDPEAMADLMLLARIHQYLVPVRPKHTLASIYGRDYDHLRKPDRWESVPARRR